MRSYTYLLIDIGCLLVPFIASFYPKHAFYKQWKPFFLANLLVAFFYLIWDALFTMKGIWGFNPDYLTGLYLGNLPLEEILFFISIPYACVFTYFALKYLVPRNPLRSYQRGITLVIALALLIVGLIALNKWYTAITFLLLAAYLLFGLKRRRDLSYHYLAYFAILPFFFISNGLLTGSVVASPIVWYDDTENLGLRMLTIPVEDVFYGMLLVFLNIDLFEVFKKGQVAQ